MWSDGVALEAVPGLVGRNERFLGNFFGIVIIAHHPVSNVVHEPGVFFGDLRKFFCVRIPCWSFTGLGGRSDWSCAQFRERQRSSTTLPEACDNPARNLRL